MKELATTSLVGCQNTPLGDVKGENMKIYVHGYVNADGDMPVQLDTDKYSLAFCDAVLGYVTVTCPVIYAGTPAELTGKAIRAAEQALVATGDFTVGNNYGTIFCERRHV